jgi:hypothetical protein
MSAAWLVSGLSATVLLVLLIRIMQTRGYFTVYPILSVFIVSNLLTGVAEWAILLKFYSLSSDGYRSFYWTNEFVLQSLLFLVMLSFIYRAWEGHERRFVWTAGVFFLAILGVIASVAISDPSETRKLESILSRNFSFASALLNFVLWTALIKNRGRDHQLLLLAAGLGLMTTGKAIGQSLRTIGPDTLPLGNVIIVTSQLTSFAVWLWTLHSVPARDRSGRMAVPGRARDASA